MLRDTVAKDGEGTLQYDFVKPGQQVPLPKISYVAGIPAWNMFIGVGAYLDDLDLKLQPLIAAIGLAMLRDCRHCRRDRLADQPQHHPPAGRARHAHEVAGRRLAR